MKRRTFIGLGATLPWALSSCWADDPGPGPEDRCHDLDETAQAQAEDPRPLPIDRERFPLVPHAGAMGSQEVLLWGFLAGHHDFRFVVWREEGDLAVVVVNEAVRPQEGYAKLEVKGLRSGARYVFALVDDVDGTRSLASRFQTAPAPGCAPEVQVAATACTHLRNAPFAALERMAEREPDVFLQLGDMVYNDGATRTAIQARADGDVRAAKAAYRSNWHAALADPGYEALLSSVGSYFTWDDHEVTDNSRLYDLDPASHRFAADRYFETLAQPEVEPGRFWASYRWGDSVEFFVLDCRSERVVESRKEPDAIYISSAQMDWLKSALAASPCHFKAVMTSVPVTTWPEMLSVVADDRWEGYQAQRDELLDWILDEAISNVFFIGGDFHCGAVTRVERSGPRSGLFEILAGPGGNANNPLAVLWEMGSEASRVDLAPPEQFLFLRSQPAGTLITFDPQGNKVVVEYIEPETGNTITRLELRAGESEADQG
ncbi:MAG: hypothetical protein CMH55_03305 [Myxococcales bacterium]|nr:hypothetical protein [Myxococcales bacterium]